MESTSLPQSSIRKAASVALRTSLTLPPGVTSPAQARAGAAPMKVHSPAASPFPGHLIATGVPGGSAIAAALLVAAGLTIGVWLVRRPPRDAPAAAQVCAIGLLIATLLMPATRFGYLLYPAAYAVWAVALHRPAAVPQDPPRAARR